MDYIICALSILAIVLLLLFSFYQKRQKKIEKNEYLLKRFIKNIDQSHKLINELEETVKKRNAWSRKVFQNSDITFSDYIEALKKREEMENNFTTLKKKISSLNENKDFTEKLKRQSDALYQQKIEFGEIMLKFESEDNL